MKVFVYFLFIISTDLHLFFPMFPFHPPKNIRKPLILWRFQGDVKGTLAEKGLQQGTLYFLDYR